MSSLISIALGKNIISGPISGCRLALQNAVRLQYLAILNIIYNIFFVVKNNTIKTLLYKVLFIQVLVFFSFLSPALGQAGQGVGALTQAFNILKANPIIGVFALLAGLVVALLSTTATSLVDEFRLPNLWNADLILSTIEPSSAAAALSCCLLEFSSDDKAA